MWMALNFVVHDISSSQPEDVGASWFDKLVEMSFFQLAWDSKGYVIPSLMHDLTIIVSSEECFYLSDQSQEIPHSVRHLALDTKNLGLVKRIQKYKKLRSFLYFGLSHVDEMYSAINDTLYKLDGIRVLDLSYLHMETKEPPKAIQNLSHLRFLDLSSTGIKVLSHSSFDHYHLQALYIQKCQFRELPRSINKLINLRHLNVDDKSITLISGIGNLTNLQKLSWYPVGEKEGHKVSELKNLREIRGYLKIDNCENIKSKEEAMQANLGDKKHLDSVEIYWSTKRRKFNTDMNILEGLKPHEHIKELFIRNYLGPFFPDWLTQMGNFVNTIEVSFCRSIEILPPLGQLPSLKVLHLNDLDSIKAIDHNFYGNNQTVFPVLRLFKFTSDSCEEWTEELVREFFPYLSFLEIICQKIRKVPFHCFCASLKVLRIQDCHSLNSLEMSLHHLSCLTILSIMDSRISISLNLNYLMSLEDLGLWRCPELRIEGDMLSLTNLKSVEIRDCPKLVDMSLLKRKGLQIHQREGLRSLISINMDFLNQSYHVIVEKLPSLQILKYRHWQHSQFTTYDTLWFQGLTSLKELYFFDCEFEHLPSSLATLSLLKRMWMVSCTKLEFLPENGMPPFLWELTLSSCTQNLVQRCQPNNGEDWPIISHVALIRIDGRVIHRTQIPEVTSG
ncbi:Disease resistance protein (TIR-NBS-LRR class) family [Rhynchospora pubera]|uniref:Disease resistance protein (TIR-NBS-LRR class) family n=1 Tax=Rhynchospora pubera TaxID=906938 RepID=A0AAV8FH53_9POAL|nr:Disease resistance protein (TIR-NBS-LRR class) family [Rhynchospora pubera]